VILSVAVTHSGSFCFDHAVEFWSSTQGKMRLDDQLLWLLKIYDQGIDHPILLHLKHGLLSHYASRKNIKLHPEGTKLVNTTRNILTEKCLNGE